MQDGAEAQHFVCREHLLVTSTVYCAAGVDGAAATSATAPPDVAAAAGGATEALHLLSVLRPRVEHLHGEAKRRCALVADETARDLLLSRRVGLEGCFSAGKHNH